MHVCGITPFPPSDADSLSDPFCMLPLLLGFDQPCLCLCFGFSQMMRMLPFLLMTLHFSQIGLTDDLTFIGQPPFPCAVRVACGPRCARDLLLMSGCITCRHAA